MNCEKFDFWKRKNKNTKICQQKKSRFRVAKRRKNETSRPIENDFRDFEIGPKFSANVVKGVARFCRPVYCQQFLFNNSLFLSKERIVTVRYLRYKLFSLWSRSIEPGLLRYHALLLTCWIDVGLLNHGLQSLSTNTWNISATYLYWWRPCCSQW